MRFFLDQDVDVAVRKFLVDHGHECWSANQAGLSASSDDYLTVYAIERGAVLVTHDREFSRRRRQNAIGRHIFLECDELDAVEVLAPNLAHLERLLPHVDDVMITISKTKRIADFGWR